MILEWSIAWIDCAFGVYPIKIGYHNLYVTDSEGHHIKFLKT
jgi:hypothetical protein